MGVNSLLAWMSTATALAESTPRLVQWSAGSSLDGDVLLTSLQLVAVQPACLRAHADTPLPHHELQPAQGLPDHTPHHQQQDNDAAADLQHHQLLLQLRASLTQQTTKDEPVAPRQGHQLQVSAITGGATASTCHLLPLPVQTAVLQVVLLNRQMQVLLHKQYSFQQLLQDHQQQQPPAQPPPSWLAAGSSTAAATASSSHGFSSHSHTLHQELQLNIHVSAPSQPSAFLLDALHLFVSLCSEQLADPAGGQADPPAACLVAEMPLLVMPAQAQQEVQQLLLPAMRQDVQSEGQQQGEQLDAAAVAARALLVEQAGFRHFSQLSLDILLIMQLADAVRAEAAQANAGSVAHSAFESSQPMSPSAHHNSGAVAAAPAGAGTSADAQHQIQHSQQQQEDAGEGAEQALLHSSAMSNLMQAVHALLLPLLLPFLTAHGLHSTLQVLLQCLPPQLQLQQHWQQEQLVRLQALTSQAQQQPDQGPDAPQQLEQLGHTEPAATAAAAAPGGGEGVLVSTSAVLDTLSPPRVAGSGGTAAPAGADCSCTASSQSASIYKSGRSSPAQDSEAGDTLEQQLQDLQHLRYGAVDADLAPGTPPAAADAAADAAAGAAGPGRSSSSSGAGHGSSGAWDVGHGSSAAGAGGLRRRGAPLAVSPAGGLGTTSSEQGGGQSDGSAADMFCFGVLSRATSMPCWLVPFKQFQDPETERRYVAFKHQRLLYLDLLGGIYQIAMACALLKHLQHPFTLVVLVMSIVKALPHLPLLLGGNNYREQHIRSRELWMFLSAPGTALVFLVCLFSGTWQHVTMHTMAPAFFAFLRVRGELTAAALRAFFHHQRLRPFLLYMAVDRMVCVHLWAPFLGGAAALSRALLAGVMSVLMCWVLELYFRRRFVLAGLYS